MGKVCNGTDLMHNPTGNAALFLQLAQGSFRGGLALFDPATGQMPSILSTISLHSALCGKGAVRSKSGGVSKASHRHRSV